MTREELLRRQKELRNKYLKDFDELQKSYADEHCPAKVGDIVRGANGWIRVEKIYYETTLIYGNIGNTPYCSFFGSRVTSDGKPYKNGAMEEVYPWSLKEVNGVKVKYNYKS